MDNDKALIDRNVWALARAGGTEFEPDSKTSDGGQFLADCAIEAEMLWREHRDAEDAHAFAHEAADRVIPHQTFKRWAIWLELGGYQDPDPDGISNPVSLFEPSFQDLPIYYLYSVASGVMYAVINAYENMEIRRSVRDRVNED